MQARKPAAWAAAALGWNVTLRERRRAGRAGGPAVDAGRAHRGVEDPVEPPVAGLHRAVAGLAVQLWSALMRPSWPMPPTRSAGIGHGRQRGSAPTGTVEGALAGHREAAELVVLLVSSVAITAAASVVPAERISAVHADRGRGLAGRHGVQDQRRHGGVPDPDAGRGDARRDQQLPGRVHQDERHEVAQAEHGGADHQGALGADAAHQTAGDRGEDHHHQAARSHPETGRQDRLAQAVAGGLRHLQELRDHDRLRHHPEPDGHGGEVGHQHRELGGGAQVDQRVVLAELEDAPQHQDDEADRRSTPRCGRCPSPRCCPWRRR